MVHIAYNKETYSIIAFLINDYEIVNPAEVFDGFENYIYKVTNILPPLSNYKKYKVEIKDGEIVDYLKIE